MSQNNKVLICGPSECFGACHAMRDIFSKNEELPTIVIDCAAEQTVLIDPVSELTNFYTPDALASEFIERKARRKGQRRSQRNDKCKTVIKE